MPRGKPSLIHRRPLPYESALDSRSPDAIDLVVIHCTELPDLAMARVYGEVVHHQPAGTGNSGHYYVDRDGRIEEWVGPTRVAHHVRGFNGRSIGIELVNRGRYPDWLHSERQSMQEPYPEDQVLALLGLLRRLGLQFESLRWIAGHEDLDRGTVPASNDSSLRVRRKLDPGPLFPWPQVLSGLALQQLVPDAIHRFDEGSSGIDVR